MPNALDGLSCELLGTHGCIDHQACWMSKNAPQSSWSLVARTDIASARATIDLELYNDLAYLAV